mmetsp:Transcript_22804/g.53260  ORF Transcript_22804/g.53260 Transcript_22804/m.53260 type:complete len:422 (-) Transcript_22804:224-1489(-)
MALVGTAAFVGSGLTPPAADPMRMSTQPRSIPADLLSSAVASSSISGTAAILFGCAVPAAVHALGKRRRVARSKHHVCCKAVETSLKADEALKVARGKARDRQNEGQTKMRSEEEYGRYRVEFAADDAPEWREASVLAMEALPNGDRLIDVEVEASRQIVPLKYAYRMPGQRLRLRLGDHEAVCELPVATPPPSLGDNHQQLMNLKGDIFAGSTKSAIDVVDSKVRLQAVLPSGSELAEALSLAELPMQVEAGSFGGLGVNVLPLAPVFRNRVLLMICEESCSSIATLRALIDSEDSASDLQLWHRDGTLLMQFAAKEESEAESCLQLLDNSRLDTWEEKYKVRSFRALGKFDESISECIRNFIQVKGVEPVSAGALVLGSPDFTKTAIQQLTSEIGLPRAQVICGIDEAIFAHVVDPEQI